MKNDFIYLRDIIEAVEVIEYYLDGVDIELFENHKMTQDAVIRQIAIIGEAIGRISNKITNLYPQLPVKQSVAMRNILVHDYDWIDVEEVWKTTHNDLPKLKRIVKKILRENE